MSMVREIVTDVIAKACKKAYGTSVRPEATYPDAQHGDVSTNVAFQLAKPLKKNPQEIAVKITALINDPRIAKTDVAGGGFINVTLSNNFWAQSLQQIRPSFATNQIGKGKKVQVEFISANPTGPLTLGNARGGYSGDVLANVLASSGFKVEREYYINDFGSQVDELLKAVKANAGLLPVTKNLQYQGQYVDELAKKLKPKLSQPDTAKQVVEAIMNNYIRPAIKKMDINFDVWLSENQELHQSGRITQMLKRLRAKKLAVEHEGAVWLKGGSPTDRERVLVRSSGEPTYLLADLAYHWNKLSERKFDRVINLWGSDHAGQVPSLQSGLEQLGLGGRLDIILFQLVRLIRGGKVIKVSKRAGTYVTIDELLEEIPSDVARWFFLMRSANTHLDFDLDLAKEQSEKNPFWYVMYAYVRAQSILKKATSKQLVPVSKVDGLSDKERILVRQLCKLAELIAEIAESYEVHKLTFYGVELAKIWHDYYEGERIIDLPKRQAAQKLFLIKQFVTSMEAYFGIMGITPKTKM